MKNYLFLFITFLAFSCTKEAIVNDQSPESKRLSATCATNNPYPFVDIYTFGTYTPGYADHGCFSTNSLECFPHRVRRLIHSEFLNGPKGNLVSSTNYFFNTGLVSFTQMGLSSSENIDPMMSASSANLLYDYVVCELKDYINTLPPLPAANQYYFPRVRYCETDFSFSGPQPSSSYFSIEVTIEVKSTN